LSPSQRYLGSLDHILGYGPVIALDILRLAGLMRQAINPHYF
jgi:hypothetical protein